MISTAKTRTSIHALARHRPSLSALQGLSGDVPMVMGSVVGRPGTGSAQAGPVMGSVVGTPGAGSNKGGKNQKLDII